MSTAASGIPRTKRRFEIRYHLVVLAVSSTILLLGASLSPTREAVSLWGWTVPPMCVSVLVLGVECHGCGLTRAMSFMMHGHWRDAVAMNWLIVPIFVTIASQVPFRIYKAYRFWSSPILPDRSTEES